MNNRNLAFIIKRLLYSILILWGICLLIFFVVRIIPGDPARMALGTQAPEDVVERLRVEMHYDKPIFIQYYYWFKNVLRGNLGISLVTKHPVLEDISELFPATFEIALYAFIFIAVVGTAIGVFSARYSNSWVDNLGRIFAYFGIVTPQFVFAIMGMLLFCYVFKILPSMGRLDPTLTYPAKITGLITIDALLQGNFIVFFDALKHLILPVLSVGLGGMAQSTRITRTSVYNNMRKDFIAAAQSYGVPDRVIMFRDLLKVSMNPTVSILGLQFATTLSNAFLVELIFNWPGFARYGMTAMLQKDLNAISGVVLTVAIFVMLGNIFADIVNSFLDPRVYLLSTSKE